MEGNKDILAEEGEIPLESPSKNDSINSENKHQNSSPLLNKESKIIEINQEIGLLIRSSPNAKGKDIKELLNSETK